jgi:putative tryptophan/tyrosine transport system substrate-binding protein
MRRREFIGLIGAAAGLPIAVRAQEPVQRRRLGVLMAIAEDDPLRQTFLAALSDGLRRSGWFEGQNIEVDYRWAGAGAHKADGEVAGCFSARRHHCAHLACDSRIDE